MCIRDRCVCGEMCSNNACDLNCVCSFRMSFLFVFMCLYISNCSSCLLYTSGSEISISRESNYANIYLIVFVFTFSNVVTMKVVSITEMLGDLRKRFRVM